MGEITANVSDGTTTVPVTINVEVGNPPEITSFAADDATVISGTDVVLSWAATGTPTYTLDGVAVSGTSATVTPTASQTYTLIATNSFGTDTETVTVTVGTAPTIGAFTIDDTTVVAGTTVTLAWTTFGAISRSINGQDVSLVVTQTRVVNATTTFTLTASNNFGAVTASVTVTVGTVPSITSFAADDASLIDGESTDLTWAVTGATSLSINQSIGTVTAIQGVDGYEITPDATITYTLTATNSYGTTTRTVTVVVSDNEPPVWSTIPTQYVAVGATKTLDLSAYATDPESDPLTFTAVESSADISIVLTGASLVITGVSETP